MKKVLELEIPATIVRIDGKKVGLKLDITNLGMFISLDEKCGKRYNAKVVLEELEAEEDV